MGLQRRGPGDQYRRGGKSTTWLVQGIKEAKLLRDYSRIRYLQHDLRDLSTKLSIPLYVLGSVVVPKLQPLQNAAIHWVTRKMVGSVADTAWEKQAINKVVRVVRNNPKTVRSVCEKAARQFDSLPSRPPCLCHLMHDVPGYKIEIEGHLAFVPIHMCYPDGTTVRPNDPLPLPGNSVRKHL